MWKQILHQLDTFSRVVSAQIWLFLGVFFVVTMLSYAFLYVIDFIPEAPARETSAETSEANPEADERGTHAARAPVADSSPLSAAEHDTTAFGATEAILPTEIVIDALDRTVPVQNPESSSIAALDEALLQGAVRHPESATFEEPGNMFILAHSSYLPNVVNRNFQAFNGLQNLSWGDTIRVRSATQEYVYRVERVYEARASEVVVPVSFGEARLTLATCNTFGAREDRFIVEAVFVGATALTEEV